MKIKQKFYSKEFLLKLLVEEKLPEGKIWHEISQKEQNAIDNYNRAIKHIISKL